MKIRPSARASTIECAMARLVMIKLENRGRKGKKEKEKKKKK
jgi:hypothetical protein